MRRSLSVKQYENCYELLKSIVNYCEYNSYKTNTTVKQNVLGEVVNKDLVQPVKNKNRIEGSNVVCFNCRKTGHISRNCDEPQKRIKCEKCNKSGHSAKECKQASQLPKSACNSIETIKEQMYVKTIEVNGVKAKALIDSGSARSLVKKDFADNFDQNMKEKCFVRLRGFAGSEYECFQQMKANILIDEVRIDNQLLVVASDKINYSVLIGKDVLCSHGNRFIIEGEDCWMQSNVNVVEHVLDGKDNEELNKILKRYDGRFSTLGKAKISKMCIKLEEHTPINAKPYRLPFAKRPILEDIICDLLAKDVIRVSESAYAAPVVLVEKKNNEHRLCVDYRQLNRVTVKQPFPMPVMDELFASLAGSVYYSTLDFNMGYHQIELDDDSKQYTAFVSNSGHYEYNRMPFGLVNAPSVFQDMMNKIVTKMKPYRVLAYLDDVVIPSGTVKEGLMILERFLNLLEECGLTLRYAKCKFLVREIKFLGHQININGISPGESKVKAIQNFKKPATVTEVRRFLGLTGFFRKFVKEYALIARPLTNLTKKDAANNFVWGDEHDAAFQYLIDALSNEPVLTLYDFQALHEVHTDASSVGLAAVLLQSADDGKTWKAVMYFSRRCTEVESLYHAYELEVMAVVEALTRFRIYILGKHFKVITDCSAISSIRAKTQLIPRIARWWMRLMEYDFECVHKPGVRMGHVDALSRAPIEQDTESVEVTTITEGSDDWLLTMQLQDSRIREISNILKGKMKSDQVKQLKQDFRLQNNRLYKMHDNKLLYVVPNAVRWRIVKYCHDDKGHFGLEKTIQRIYEYFWFPKVRKYVKEYIAACIDCCYNKNKGGKREGDLHIGEIDPIPFRTLHVDHLGPFTKSKKGNCYVLAVSDAFSKYLVVKAVRNTKTQPVLQVLNDMTSYFGLPVRIISDRGTAFTSKQFSEFCEQNDIQHIKTAVRTPRANGQVERANLTILNFLRTAGVQAKQWDEQLRRLQWSVNTQRNSSTGFSPNELIYDFKLRDVIRNRLLAAVIDDTGEQSIAEKRETASQRIQQQREKWKKRFDEKHRKPTMYEADDLVVIENVPQSTGDSRKLDVRYRGPYVVSKVLGNDRYLIEDIDGMQHKQKRFCSVYTTDKMKPWCMVPPELDTDPEEDSNCGTETMPLQDWPNCQVIEKYNSGSLTT